ncbi:DUF3016 domain-containing protein [Thermodesulfobacteriota bacterium]
MKKYIIYSFMVCTALCCTLSAQAALLEIEWIDTKKYRDIRASNENQKYFEERVINNLTRFFRTAAEEHLPADQTLYVRITDLDLAGDVDYFFARFGQPVRVVREIFFPSIEFSYIMRDARDQVIKSGEENIRDMGFLFYGARFKKNPPFDFEKKMIEDWFKNTFK